MIESAFPQYPYQIELRAHTSPISPCGEIPRQELVGVARRVDAALLRPSLYLYETCGMAIYHRAF